MKHKLLSLLLVLFTAIAYAQPSVNAGNDAFICSGQSVQLMANVTGGTPPYNYQWSPSSHLSQPDVGNPVAWPAISTAYSVTVTDNNNLTATDTVYITVFDRPVVVPTITAITCFGAGNGSITLSVTGGNSPYVYSWSNEITTQNTNNLVAGTYSVTVTDINGCSSSAEAIVTEPTAVALSLNSITDASCGANDGAIQMSLTGGTVPYTCWLNGGPTQPTPVFNGLAAGEYLVSVFDSNGCPDTMSVTVNQTTQIALSFTNIVGASCGLNDGSVCALPSGGSGPYTFAWSNAAASSCISNLPVGIYNITVSDMNACTATGTVTINSANSNIVITTDSIFDVSCHGGATGSIYIDVSGGTVPYSYLWSNGSTTQIQVNLPVGTYTVTVTDNAGCQKLKTFVIGEPAALGVSTSVTNVTCFGGSDGSIIPTVNGGAVPYTYFWSNGTITDSVINLSASIYVVTVNDANGCSASASGTITQPLPITVSITNTGDGILPDTLFADVTGGTPPYTYMWNNLSVANSNIISAVLDYDIVVADANGCQAFDTISIGCPDSCVWPGDADYSGVADNNDLLAIGLGYGTTGTARADQSIGYYGHQSANWNDYLGDTTNYKHIDCNGDGTINSDDTLAIVQNYSFTHPRNGADEVRGGIPSLRIRMVPDTLEDGQTVIAHLELGDANSTASDVYGLAFTFNFDALVVDTDEVYIAFGNNSWLCNSATDHIDISKKDAGAGKLHTAITRIDHTTRSGSGEIGQVSMKITTGNINGKDLAHYTMNCYITDLHVIDNQGHVLEVDAIGDAASVQYEPTGINEVNWKGEVALFPNPAKQQLTISSTQMPISGVQVNNLLGETVSVQQNLATNKTTIDISALTAGVYVLKLNSGNRVYHTKFIVVK